MSKTQNMSILEFEYREMEFNGLRNGLQFQLKSLENEESLNDMLSLNLAELAEQDLQETMLNHLINTNTRCD